MESLAVAGGGYKLTRNITGSAMAFLELSSAFLDPLLEDISVDVLGTTQIT
jgi:hypothetical protein